ncbi:unnamed protein product [Acanthoscelides obtectus]|uniref:F-box domain-containing protein n=1 Tax=Acanthoscelides obtectus TaxID=200917 RepID=A0A9P0JQV0_ACAOB|nr:unnamed protein product [Acanthoscelides obtectus]CAK1672954.1 hypothetical protein AOBTE_LOCUS29158 [Acanthoscelides obtectus]
MMNRDIEDFFAEEETIVQSAVARKEMHTQYQKAKVKYFETRNAALQGYYLRLSWESKKKFLVNLLSKLRGLNTILHILHLMAVRALKVVTYDFVDPNTEAIQDKLLLDHNRMLDPDVLKQTIDDDIEWFTTLTEEAQVTVFLGLLRLTGGAAKRAMYIPVWRRYFQLVKEMNLLMACDKTTVTDGGDYICYIKVAFDEDEFDANRPADVEVRRLRMEWEQMIEAYKRDVNKTTEFLRSVVGIKKGPKKQEDKDDKDSKEKVKKKGDKKSKKEKFAKAVQADEKSEIDVIQLLPIWTVKRIFNFLDVKSLQNCKKVSKYWAYVVQEMMKEMKARQQINKQLASIKQSVGEDKINEIRERLKNHTSNVRKKNKDIRHYDLGAVAEKLLPELIKTNLKETSLLQKAVKQMPDEFGENVALTTFPRLIKSDMDMYRFKSCFMRDVAVHFDVEEDVKRQKSLLTYSLQSIVDSLKLDVDQSLLADW